MSSAPKRTAEMAAERRRSAGGRAAGMRLSKVRIAVIIILVLVAVLSGIAVLQFFSRGYVSFFGYCFFRITTGSMEPTLPVNTLIVSKKTKVSELKEGDIICYVSAMQDTLGKVITHRVSAVLKTDEGFVIETRGDANPTSDRNYVAAGSVIGKVVSYDGSGSVTSFVSFAASPRGFLIILVFPVLIISAMIMRGTIADIRDQIREISREKGAEDGEAPLEGYSTVTAEDYKEIYDRLTTEIEKELNGSAEKRGPGNGDCPTGEKSGEGQS